MSVNAKIGDRVFPSTEIPDNVKALEDQDGDRWERKKLGESFACTAEGAPHANFGYEGFWPMTVIALYPMPEPPAGESLLNNLADRAVEWASARAPQTVYGTVKDLYRIAEEQTERIERADIALMAAAQLYQDAVITVARERGQE